MAQSEGWLRLAVKLDKIQPLQLKKFAESLGWVNQVSPAPFPIYILSHPDFKYRQLVFPDHIEAPDYLDAMDFSLRKLASLHQQDIETVYTRILETSIP